MAEAAARALHAAGVAVVPVQPPPYVLALAWRLGEQPAAAHRFLAYLRDYRDRHQWITGRQAAPPSRDLGRIRPRHANHRRQPGAAAGGG
jgi:hypothetical protein